MKENDNTIDVNDANNTNGGMDEIDGTPRVAAVTLDAPVDEIPDVPADEAPDASVDETPCPVEDGLDAEPAVETEWAGFAASIPGSRHIREELPCQDASAFVDGAVQAVIACDGRGSSDISQDGSSRAAALFASQVSILAPWLAEVLNCPESTEHDWRRLARVLHRTLAQAKTDLVAETGNAETCYDFTVAFAVRGQAHIGCFQVGDGALVVRDGGVCRTVFAGDGGEFANETRFLRSGEEEDDAAFHCALLPASRIDGIAAMTDGVKHRMFHLADMVPGPAFDVFFDGMADGTFDRGDLLAYLTRSAWTTDPRDGDDRTLALMAPAPVESFAEF